MTLQAGDQILESRILHLPMAFDDCWTRECISRYMRSARQEAPYLPSNIEFVANNNGTLHLALLGSVKAVCLCLASGHNVKSPQTGAYRLFCELRCDLHPQSVAQTVSLSHGHRPMMLTILAVQAWMAEQPLSRTS